MNQEESDWDLAQRLQTEENAGLGPPQHLPRDTPNPIGWGANYKSSEEVAAELAKQNHSNIGQTLRALGESSEVSNYPTWTRQNFPPAPTKQQPQRRAEDDYPTVTRQNFPPAPEKQQPQRRGQFTFQSGPTLSAGGGQKIDWKEQMEKSVAASRNAATDSNDGGDAFSKPKPLPTFETAAAYKAQYFKDDPAKNPWTAMPMARQDPVEIDEQDWSVPGVDDEGIQVRNKLDDVMVKKRPEKKGGGLFVKKYPEGHGCGPHAGRQHDDTALQTQIHLLANNTKMERVECIVVAKNFTNNTFQYVTRIDLYIMGMSIRNQIIAYSPIRDGLLYRNCEVATIGNIVSVPIKEVKLGHYSVSHEVWNEEWTYQRRISYPHRTETSFSRIYIQMILDCEVLSMEAQWRFRDQHKVNCTFLVHKEYGNVGEYKGRIDERLIDQFDFRVKVMPQERLVNHVYWTVIDVMEAIPKEFKGISAPAPEGNYGPAPKLAISRTELGRVQAVNTVSRRLMDVRKGANQPSIRPRDDRCKEAADFASQLLQNQHLMDTLQERTGNDYGERLRKTKANLMASIPERKIMRRELMASSYLFLDLINNIYTQEVFDECGQPRLYDALETITDQLKAFRSN